MPGLPDGIASRFVHDVNGLRMHVLEAGDPGRPCVLLLHGFPELAYSWRAVMPALAQAGYHVLAPDQRGYGATTGCDDTFTRDLTPFAFPGLVADMCALLARAGIDRVACVAGHDFGSPVAAWCALTHPQRFTSVALLSAPLAGVSHAGAPAVRARWAELDRALAALDPPRKHYQTYYSTRSAASDMVNAPQGLHAFLRAYFHAKSANWSGNRPTRLTGDGAAMFAELPAYYVMPRAADMPGAVAPLMPDAREIAACTWLTESALAVYSQSFARTGFQGGLNWYRAVTQGVAADRAPRAGSTIGVPALFIAGAQDWGVYQTPGVFERMPRACAHLRGVHLLKGAGHWVQQERGAEVSALLIDFLKERSLACA